MALLDVLVPQMGEGLQEVVVVGFHKKPGDTVKRDELLYSMETDKAVMDVESPYEGTIEEWLATEGTVLPIGATIARMKVSDSASKSAGAALPTPASKTESSQTSVPSALEPSGPRRSNLVIPPRTRALCKQLGISEDEMHSIPAATGKLMPSDVEAYRVLAGDPKSAAKPDDSNAPQTEAASTVVAAPPRDQKYSDTPLTQQQRVFTSRIRRSSALVIPATMTRPIKWAAISECTLKQRELDFTFRPTEFQCLAWCVAQATIKHPKLRSTLLGDESVREFEHVNIGIAVSLPNGELVSAVVRKADTLDFHDFVLEAQSAIVLAREGKDQADATTQLHLTYMGAFGITEATPLLVAPAIAVLFVGASYPREGSNWVNLSLTFDHRLINGVEGARFLTTVVETIDGLEENI